MNDEKGRFVPVTAGSAENRFSVLDLFRDLNADIAHSNADEARFTLDGRHPNAADHQRIAEILAAFCEDRHLLGNL